MDLQINIAKNGQHYFFVTVRNIYTEREIFEKLQETYPESEGFELSLSRVYEARKKIDASDLK